MTEREDNGSVRPSGAESSGFAFESVVVDPEREAYWQRLIREAREDPEYAEAFDRELSPDVGTPRQRLEPELNPEWERSFGFRGRVAKLLFERGLKRKAVRFANCGKLGRPGVCSRYPFEHKYYVLHGCSVIFCRECGAQERRRLMMEYLPAVLAVVLERSPDGRLPHGWVLARLNFTLRSDGSEIVPDRVRRMNGAAKRTLRKSVGSRSGYGLLYCDEVGFELRGHVSERKAGGLNLHLHGLYFGPRLDWRRTRDIWAAETREEFGVESLGFWIQSIRILRGDLEGAARHALNHLLKYVSKPPAVSPERLASLISAFDRTRRVHALGLFHGKKPKRERRDCPCPSCKAQGVSSVVCFEGRLAANGGQVPRLIPIEDLIRDGYEELRLAGRAAIFSVGVSREECWGASPP
jgi:hypothetical protein